MKHSSGRNCRLQPKVTTNSLHPRQVRGKSNNLFLMLAFYSECSVLKYNSDPEMSGHCIQIYKFNIPPVNLNSMDALQKRKAVCI